MKTIERLRGLEAKATDAPWGIDHDKRDGGVDQIVECRSGRTLTVAFGTSDGNEYDFPLIAATRNALPALLAVVEAQAAEIEAWRNVHAASCNASRIGKIHGGRGALLEEAMKDAHACVAVAKDAVKSTDAALRAMEGGAG